MLTFNDFIIITSAVTAGIILSNMLMDIYTRCKMYYALKDARDWDKKHPNR